MIRNGNFHFLFDGLPMTGRTRTVAGTASCAQCVRTEARRGVTREAADQLTESARVGTVLCRGLQYSRASRQGWCDTVW